MFREKQVAFNVLFPLNMAAVYFGVRLALHLIHIDPAWSDYTLAMLVILGTVTLATATLTYTKTWH